MIIKLRRGGRPARREEGVAPRKRPRRAEPLGFDSLEARALMVTGWSFEWVGHGGSSLIDAYERPAWATGMVGPTVQDIVAQHQSQTSTSYSFGRPSFTIGSGFSSTTTSRAPDPPPPPPRPSAPDPGPLFDESYYLLLNPDVRRAVEAGVFLSGFDHYRTVGINEGRDPSPYFSEAFYRGQNPDIAAAISSHVIRSGFEHYLRFGMAEGRDPSPYYSDRVYLLQNPDVAAAVASGAIASGYLHYVAVGRFEGRSATPLFFEPYYLSQNADVADAVAAGQFRSGFEHFLAFGKRDGRRGTPMFDEVYYRAQNPDVAAAVAQGIFPSGFDHYATHGSREGRAASAYFSESAYLQRYPDVRAAVAAGAFRSGYDHYVSYGIADGRIGLPDPDSPPPVTISGTLTTRDPRIFGGHYAEAYRYTPGSSGSVVVRMDSNDVDSVLLVALLNNDGSLNSFLAADDDSGVGENAKVRFDYTAGRKYLIIATTREENERGIFALTFSNVASQTSSTRGADGSTILTGSLDSSDPSFPAGSSVPRPGSYADAYFVRASAGGTATITMSSETVDPYLVIFVINPDGSLGPEVDRDDDSGAGSDARVRFSTTAGRRYGILVTEYSQRRGPYTLTLSSNLAVL